MIGNLNYGSPCEINSDKCNVNLHLSCKNYKCNCSNTFYYNQAEMECGRISSILNRNLFGFISFLKLFIFYIEPKKSYNEKCSLNLECTSNTQCINAKCQCTEDLWWNSTDCSKFKIDRSQAITYFSHVKL